MTSKPEQRALRNIGYTSIAKAVTYVSSAASSIILGRCLLASDYGVVSFAFIFLSFMDKFADIGIGTAIIQRKELNENVLFTAFTLKFIFGVTVTVVTFILSTLVTHFTDNDSVVVVLKVLSLCFLFNNISFIPTATLTREMNFKRISVVETIVSFCNSVIAIGLALNGYGFWSIVFANLFSNLLSAILLVLCKPVSVGFRVDLTVARQLVSFGGYLFFSGLLAFFMSNVDNFIIGTVKGTESLGYYALAFNWGSMVCLIMYSVVLRVIFPVMAKLQDQVMDLKSTYLKTIEYSGYVIVLANVALFATSREFLVGILGHGTDKWLPALTALRILCCYGIIRGLLEPVGQVVAAIGKTRVIFHANVAASIIESAAIYPALKYYGIEGVAFVVTIAYLTQYFVFYFYLKNHMRVTLSELIKAIKPSVIAATPVLFLFLLLSPYQSGSIFFFFMKSLMVLAVYGTTLGMVTDWKFLRTLKRHLIDTGVARDITVP